MKMQLKFSSIVILLTLMNWATAWCPSPYTASGYGCYYIPPQSSITWYNAQANCQLDYGGYLVEINSLQEHQDVLKVVKSQDQSFQYYYWLGGSDVQKEGTFRWMASGKYFSYTNWWTGEPDNYLNLQDCVHLYGLDVNTLQWGDNNCCDVVTQPNNRSMKAICETEPIW